MNATAIEHPQVKAREAGDSFAESRLSRICAAAALCGAIVILAGWAANLPILTRWFGNGVPVHPHTAFLCAVVAAGVLLAPFRSHTALLTARALAMIALLPVATRLVFPALMKSTGFGNANVIAGAAPMAMGTEIGIAGLAAALLLMTSTRPRLWAAGSAALLAPLSVSYFAILGYLYSIQSLYSIGTKGAMAVTTALLMLSLSVGVASTRPLQGVLSPLSSPRAAGHIARWVLPLTFVLPIILGWLRIHGEQHGWFESRVGTTAVQTVVALMCSGLVLSALHLAEQERIRAEAVVFEYQFRLEHEVEQRTAELKALNRELESFSYSVSHDLRAPLRHVHGFTRILLDEYGSTLPLEAQHYLGRIERGAMQMGLLIDDLLKLGRIGRQDIVLAPVQLEDLVQEVVRELRAEAKGRKVEFKIGALPWIKADRGLMKQVLVNLISNAMKFSAQREAAVIEVGTATRGEDACAVYVRDNGVGFDMAYADKLFGVFQRLHRAEEFEGTGVGLATVARIVQRHHGKIWAEAQLGQGATFFFSVQPVNGFHLEKGATYGNARSRDLVGRGQS